MRYYATVETWGLFAGPRGRLWPLCLRETRHSASARSTWLSVCVAVLRRMPARPRVLCRPLARLVAVLRGTRPGQARDRQRMASPWHRPVLDEEGRTVRSAAPYPFIVHRPARRTPRNGDP